MGRISYLEKVTSGGLGKLNTILSELRAYARSQGWYPSKNTLDTPTVGTGICGFWDAKLSMAHLKDIMVRRVRVLLSNAYF